MSKAAEKTIATISIRNPRILKVVGIELGEGAGRNFTEAAENMILSEHERRQVQRAMDVTPRRPRRTAQA